MYHPRKGNNWLPITVKFANNLLLLRGALARARVGNRMEDAKAAERRRLEKLVTPSVSSAGAGKGSGTGGNGSESTSLLGGEDAEPKTPLEWIRANLVCVVFSLFVGTPCVLACIGLAIALMTDPSKDFRVIDGDCKIGALDDPVRREFTSEEGPNTDYRGAPSTNCLDEYTYSYCLPEDGHFKTYPAGSSPIELCSACIDTGKIPSSTHAAVACVEGDATYWPCIAALPCMQSAKWNQHKQLSVNASHFDCEVAIHGISTGSGGNPTGSGSQNGEEAMPEKPKHRRLAGSEVDCFGSAKEVHHVCGQSCSECENVTTTPSLAEGDEITCWAPAPGMTPGFPVYSCTNPGCYKMIK